MNLPNKITMLRVIMIPFFAFFMLRMLSEILIYCRCNFIIASLTDTLDDLSQGNTILCQTSESLWTRLQINCCQHGTHMFVSIHDNPMPVWGVIVIISREFIISGFRLVAQMRVLCSLQVVGKIKTTVRW